MESGRNPDRPKTVSVVVTLQVIYGSLMILPKLYVLLSPSAREIFNALMLPTIATGPLPLPLWLHHSHGLAGSLVWVVAGVGLWKARTWSRPLMLGWAASVLFLTWSVSGFAGTFPWKLIGFVILTACLYLRSVSRWLEGSQSGLDNDNEGNRD